MRRRRKQHTDDVVHDINVTSLVDVMMTLLIIFIIVAPMLEQGIDINLPTAEPKRIDVADVLTISVSENGTEQTGTPSCTTLTRLLATLVAQTRSVAGSIAIPHFG